MRSRAILAMQWVWLCLHQTKYNWLFAKRKITFGFMNSRTWKINTKTQMRTNFIHCFNKNIVCILIFRNFSLFVTRKIMMNDIKSRNRNEKSEEMKEKLGFYVEWIWTLVWPQTYRKKSSHSNNSRVTHCNEHSKWKLHSIKSENNSCIVWIWVWICVAVSIGVKQWAKDWIESSKSSRSR